MPINIYFNKIKYLITFMGIINFFFFEKQFFIIQNNFKINSDTKFKFYENYIIKKKKINFQFKYIENALLFNLF